MVRSVLHFNNAPMRVRMYNALTELLRAVSDLCVFAQEDVDLIVTAYKQSCSYTIQCDEYYALLQLVTDSPHPAPATVKVIRNPLFLQLPLRLLASSSTAFCRHLLLQDLVDMSGNEKKKENMKNMKYDGFFMDLLLLVPRMEPDSGAPAKKPALVGSIRQCMDVLLHITSEIETPQAEKAFATLRDADCEEAFAALVQVFKSQNAQQWCREKAVDLMYESSRGRYNSVLNSIRLMLLEDVMRLYSRFSLSSMPVNARLFLDPQILSRCLRSVALPYTSEQILLLLYKLSLGDLFQMKNLSKVKAANINSFVFVFVQQFWKSCRLPCIRFILALSKQNEAQFAAMIELISRFFSDTAAQVPASAEPEQNRLDAYASLSPCPFLLIDRLTLKEVRSEQALPPTGCFFFGLWVGLRLLQYALKEKREVLVICEHMKAIVFSNQVWMDALCEA